MNKSAINLKIITPKGVFFNDEINNLYLPGELGKTGILQNHRPIILKLIFGILELEHKNNTKQRYFIKNGFLKLIDNEINLLTDKILKANDINSVEVNQKLNELNKKIGSASSGLIKSDELDRLLIERKEWVIKKKIAKGNKKNE